MSNGGQKEVSGFALGGSGVTVFAGTNGPYWLDSTGQHINSRATGVSLQDTNFALTVLRPTASSDKSRYTSLKARSAFFGVVGIDAFNLEASAIAVDLNTVSGIGSTSDSPVINFNATFNPQWAQNRVFDANNNGLVTVGELRSRSGLSAFSGGGHQLYTSGTADSVVVTWSELLAALDTGNGTSNTPDGLLQTTEVTAFLSSANDSLATTGDADNDGLLEFGYGFSTGGGSAFLRESERRIRASADNVLLNISEFVYVNGNVAIDIGKRESVTINSGVPETLAAIMGSGTLQTLRNALSSYSNALNNSRSQVNEAFESLLDAIQSRVEQLCLDIADEILNEILSRPASGIEELQTLVRDFSSNALETVSAKIANDALQPILHTLTGAFLDNTTSEPLRSLVQTIITDPLESTLTAAFQEIVAQAIGDSIGPLVAGVSDALLAISDSIGMTTELIKEAIVASLQPQLLVIRETRGPQESDREPSGASIGSTESYRRHLHR